MLINTSKSEGMCTAIVESLTLGSYIFLSEIFLYILNYN